MQIGTGIAIPGLFKIEMLSTQFQVSHLLTTSLYSITKSVPDPLPCIVIIKVIMFSGSMLVERLVHLRAKVSQLVYVNTVV